jgi:hypothetical protein
MKTHLMIAAAAAAVLASRAPADAALLDVTLPGISASNFNLIIDTTAQKVSAFTIDGVSAPAGFSSTITTSIDDYSAYYTAQIAAVGTGGAVNEIFSLDLEALNTPFPDNGNLTADAIALLTNSSQIPGNIDFTASSVTYSVSNTNGTQVAGSPVGTPLSALGVAGLNVTVVPEPASLALVASSLLGLSLIRRRG